MRFSAVLAVVFALALPIMSSPVPEPAEEARAELAERWTGTKKWTGNKRWTGTKKWTGVEYGRWAETD